MAHPEQLQFVKSILASIANQLSVEKVIEIGSHDVNGSVRRLFPGIEYIGVDLTEGPGVDLVCDGAKVNHDDRIYDLAISCECFEHNPYWMDTFSNMYRLTKDGGLILITVATSGRPEHGTTRTSPTDSPGTQSLKWDYYKKTNGARFPQPIKLSDMFGDYFFITNDISCDLYFFGIKNNLNTKSQIDIANVKNLCLQDQDDLKNLRKKLEDIKKYIPKFFRKK